MAVVAVLVFVAAYILIATERVRKMVTALVGAGIILGLGGCLGREVFYAHETGVDWDVIFRVGRSIWRRSKPHTRWEGCASRARWPRQFPCLSSSGLHHWGISGAVGGHARASH